MSINLKIVSSLGVVLISLALPANKKQWAPIYQSENKSDTQLPSINKTIFEESQDKRRDPMLLKPIKTSKALKSDNEDYNELNRAIDQQINELNKIIKKIGPGQKAELWARLGGLYVEKADLVKRLIDQKFEKDQVAGKSVVGYIDYKPAHVYNKKAIRLYQQFLKETPKGTKVDQALFFLGYNLFELGETKSGLKYYQELTSRYPKSIYIGESRFALAEFYFENDQFKEAQGHYSFVIGNGPKKLSIISMYKLSWCQFRQGEFKNAIQNLEKVIQVSNAKKAISQGINIEAEAKRDMVLFYSEGGQAERAKGYFDAIFGSEASFDQLERLAYLYSDKGNRQDAQVMFEYLIRKKPYDVRAFDYQHQIVKMYSQAKDHQAFKNQLQAWIKGFGPQSNWYAKNKASSEVVEKSNKLIETATRTWVLQQHQSAQNSRGAFSQKLALEGYKVYFSEFNKHPNAIDLHFFHGELLYDMKKYDEASVEYRWVVDNGINSKYRAQAAANILISAEKSIPKDQEIAKIVGDRTEKVNFDSVVENYISQGEWYIKNFPNDKKRLEIEFRIARLHYQYNHFEQAVPRFKKIVREHPDTKFGEYSANLLLDIYNIKKDYEGLAQASNELMAIPQIARSSVGKDILQMQDKVNFKVAQDLEKSGKIKESAFQYESYSKNNRQSELAPTAVFNAAINFNKVGLSLKSIEMIKQLNNYSDPKAKELSSKAETILPALYQSTGQLKLAAVANLKLANQSKVKSAQRDLYYNAGILFEAVDQKRDAISSFEKAYQISGPRDATMTLFEMAKLHRELGQKAAATRYLEQFLSAYGAADIKSVSAAYWLYEYNLNNSNGEKWARSVLNLHKSVSANQRELTRSFAAKVELQKVKYALAEVRNVKLNNASKLKQQSDLKISKIDQLNKAAAQAIAIGSPEETLETVFFSAEANLDLYQSLIQAPLPAELSKPEDIQNYKAAVSSLAQPFLQKAIEAYQLVIQRSAEFETYNQAYFNSRAAIEKLKPGSTYEKGQINAVSTSVDWMNL